MVRRIIGERRARQGGEGRPVLVVLIVSMVLLAIAVAAYMVWVGTSTPDTVADRASPTISDSAPLSSANNPSNPAPVSPEAGEPAVVD